MRFAISKIALLVLSTSAQAEILFSNNFDVENNGNSANNYNGFPGLDVKYGTVDLIRSGSSGITCAGFTRSCVDMYGTGTDSGTILSAFTYSFSANDVVRFSFDLSGNQRHNNVNSWFAAVDFSELTMLSNVVVMAYDTEYDLGASSRSQIALATSVVGQTPFQKKLIQFTAAEAGSFTFFIGADGYGATGPIIDNILLTRVAAPPPNPTPGVPEPGTWGMMLLGFGLVGGSVRLRSRRQGLAS